MSMYPDMIQVDDIDMTFSIDCPTCGASASELCLTKDGWGPDGMAHPDRTTAIIVECSWLVDGGDWSFIFRAVSLDPGWPGGCCPNVDEVTRDLLAEEVDAKIADVEPSADGLYHLGPLGWTFNLINR